MMYNDINYFENEFIKITLKKKNQYKFLINYNDFIDLKRLDSNEGWNKNFILNVQIKNDSKNIEVNVEKSDKNNVSIPFKFDKNFKNHFENEFIKIYHISKEFNDIFNVKYIENEDCFKIKRLDANEGWGQELFLKYIEKKNNEQKLIFIGNSNLNEKIKFIKLDEINYREKNNFYQDDELIIKINDNPYNDLFLIKFYKKTNTIFIKRVDCNEGWGQNLIINIINKSNQENIDIYIGPSIRNEIYKKINFIKYKCFVSLTTIPSRIKQPIFFENINHFLDNQTYKIEKMFITIPKKYKRFDECIDIKLIDKLKKNNKIIVIEIDEDFGPASKYLGPMIHYNDLIKDNILIVIDDDRKYNINLVKNFKIAYNSFPNIIFSSGKWNEYFNKDYNKLSENYLKIDFLKESNNYSFQFGQGVGGFFGFAILIKDSEKFINYNLNILKKIKKSFYHDEGIILGYIKYLEETIMYLHHYGCNFIKNELSDALCDSNLVIRHKVEKDILQITNLEKLL